MKQHKIKFSKYNKLKERWDFRWSKSDILLHPNLENIYKYLIWLIPMFHLHTFWIQHPVFHQRNTYAYIYSYIFEEIYEMDQLLVMSRFGYMFINVLVLVLSLMFLKLLLRCWILPVRAQKKLRENGFSGPPPSFPLGNLNDMKKLKTAMVMVEKSKSSTIINHDIHSTALPHFALWQQQYGI